MDFFKKVAASATESKNTETPEKAAPPASSEDDRGNLLSSAKLVTDAARSTFQNDPSAEKKQYDNAEVAGAAGDLLEAAQNYGKLDQSSGVGSYVEKAENYLHEYETSHSTKPTTDAPKPTSEESEKPISDDPKHEEVKGDEPKEVVEEPVKAAPEKEQVEEEQNETEPKKAEEPVESAKPSTEPEEKTSGLGDYAKAAEGFLKKDEESTEGEKKGESESAGGIGQYAKMAEGYLNKESDNSEGGKPDGGDLLKMAGGFLGKN